jgi:ATP-dependent exoDNAse (exonuclease V) alpha subunit
MRFEEIEHADKAWFEIINIHELKPLDGSETQTLWENFTGEHLAMSRLRPVQILTRGSEAVATELRQRVERGEFIEIIRERKPREATTQHLLEMEKSNIQTMLDRQGQHNPIVSNDARHTVDAIAKRQQLKLNENQRTAVEEILTSRDQIIGLQGGAGTGKTTALSVLREAAEKEGYEVRGFAPTTRATKQLAESGIQSETLQKFIRRRQEGPSNHNRLFVLDESSLASTNNLHKFFAPP